MKFRDSASFGKRQEFLTMADLLKRGYDVYPTLVDDKQIDCIIRMETEKGPKYIDIQIKARSKSAKKESWGAWPSVKLENPRKNLVYIFYSEPLETIWIIPSIAISQLGYQSKSTMETPIYQLNFEKVKKKKGKVIDFIPVEKFEVFKNAYHLIDECAIE
ncbi:MAG: hypothetical protein JEZ01_21110 [Labilibaculum sp.]|nr:hypothetical protein [Labilibaculum sp.]MBI9060280.1 hypothetical protein [Labilibaculum sp.]